MKIKLNQPVLNLENEPFKDIKDYGHLFRNVLAAPQEKKETGDEKIKKYQLAIKCTADTADLTVDERKLIKDILVSVNVNPIIFGRVNDLFEENQKSD